MKKEHIYFYLVLATFIVSFVSLGISLSRNNRCTGFDYLGVIVGILAVLVTILIGLQLYNYIFVRENIQQIVDAEIQKMVKDYEHVTEARNKVFSAYDFLVTDFNAPKIIDRIMEALKEIEQCENATMKSYTLRDTMEEAHVFLSSNDAPKEPRIYKGKRAEYLFTLKKVEHMYEPELRQYIEKAIEVDPHPQKTIGTNENQPLG